MTKDNTAEALNGESYQLYVIKKETIDSLKKVGKDADYSNSMGLMVIKRETIEELQNSCESTESFTEKEGSKKSDTSNVNDRSKQISPKPILKSARLNSDL